MNRGSLRSGATLLACWRPTGRRRELLKEAEEEAIRLKNRTLTWVYVIEWLAVTGTAMACGFLL